MGFEEQKRGETAPRGYIIGAGAGFFFLICSFFFVIFTLRQSGTESFGRIVAGMVTMIAFAFSIFLFFIFRQKNIMMRSRAALERIAYVDALTGCPSHVKFRMDAEDLLERQRDEKLAVWYCDIKRFKFINDIFGYHTGDQVLKHFVKLLSRDVADDCIFGRVAADNFAGMRIYQKKAELISWFEELSDKLAEEFSEEGTCKGLNIEISMGIYCVESADGDLSINDMTDRANMAQKSVKDKTGSQCAFFTNEIRDRIHRETEIELKEKKALESGEFLLYFQPKVGIQREMPLVGAEVLTRWRHPERGFISPGEFIPLFEKNGFIIQLDRYMFEEACKWLQHHLRSGGQPLNIAVNVSRIGLLQNDFVEFYIRIKKKYEIPNGMLELEFTESLILDDDELFRRVVIDLKKNGFICSLDDFGAGYSSLNVLKNLPIDVLKLDILFFRGGIDIERERIVISNIITMAKELQMITIAEGVEFMEQVRFLQESGCDVVQGFVFAKPMPVSEFNGFIRQWESTSTSLFLLPEQAGQKWNPSEERENLLVQKLEESHMQKRIFEKIDTVAYELNLSLDQFISGADKLAETLGMPEEHRFSVISDVFLKELVHPDDEELYRSIFYPDQLIEYYEQGKTSMELEYRLKENQTEYRWWQCNLSLYKNQEGDICAFVFLKDIDTKKKEQMVLRSRATFDALTGVYNKKTTEELIEKYLQIACLEEEECAFLLLDIDDFKLVNDTFGHAVGDRLLEAIGEGLKELFRQEDIIGRIGGDEFVIFMCHIKSARDIEKKARKVLDFFGAYPLQGQARQVSSSIGIAIYPWHGETFEELYHYADKAMYHTKRHNKNSFTTYEELRSGGPISHLDNGN